ncbi:penicillin acylase family protein [Streptomyces sp. NPDC051907]|uniref:penicillin acylase family protein n=1 Tax=Streptomyces sp. NPDC051907 TaxID=3155284 RepID=UPI003414310C
MARQALTSHSLGGTLLFRTRLRRLTLTGVALLTAAAVLPPAAAADTRDGHRPDGRPHAGGLSAVIRYTEHGIPHIVAKDYANLGFGSGWAQAADQVCVLADGFVTVRGERSRFFGPDAATDGSLSSASRNLASDQYFGGVRDARTVEKLLAAPAPTGAGRQVKELMRGWAAGYNAWLAQNRVTDPACRNAPWVRPVSTLDVARRNFAVAVLGGQGRAVDGITAAQPPASPGAPAGAASDRATDPAPDPAADLAAADTAKACAAVLPGDPQACGVLERWDRTTDVESRGALLFDRFWRKFTAAVPQTAQWKVPFSATDPVRTPHTLDTASPGFAKALRDAVAELRAAGIPLDAPLGEGQFVVRNGKRIPIHGGTESLGVWNKVEQVWNAAGGGYTETVHGSSHIQAVGWNGGRCPKARTLLAYSQSSNPSSPHFSDQTELYARERWVTSRFCERNILSSPKLRVVRVRG